jgi:hypothetical protein
MINHELVKKKYFIFVQVYQTSNYIMSKEILYKYLGYYANCAFFFDESMQADLNVEINILFSFMKKQIFLNLFE